MITIQELYGGTSTRDAQKEKDLLAVMSPFEILPFSFDVAKQAGILFRDLVKPMDFADAAIAATAIIHRIPLLTLNRADFSDVPDLDLTPIPGAP
jgi:predicted nucleic acid-binding protein